MNKQKCIYQNCKKKPKFKLTIDKKVFCMYCEQHIIDTTKELRIPIPLKVYNKMSSYGQSQIKKKEL